MKILGNRAFNVPATRALVNDTELSDLPLFSSLYQDGTDPAIIRSDYQTLFGHACGGTDGMRLTTLGEPPTAGNRAFTWTTGTYSVTVDYRWNTQLYQT